jgi:signal transduction histidine kinase
LTTELPPIIGHGVQLREVVFHLVNNSVEAMSMTTNRTRVLQVGREVNGRDEITVSVQGSVPGIDPEQLDGVFNADGTGLGLAICRMIIQGDGGQITASSDAKSGVSANRVYGQQADQIGC